MKELKKCNKDHACEYVTEIEKVVNELEETNKKLNQMKGISEEMKKTNELLGNIENLPSRFRSSPFLGKMKLDICAKCKIIIEISTHYLFL